MTKDQDSEASDNPEVPEDQDADTSDDPEVPEYQDIEASAHHEVSVAGVIDDGNTQNTPYYVITMYIYVNITDKKD